MKNPKKEAWSYEFIIEKFDKMAHCAPQNKTLLHLQFGHVWWGEFLIDDVLKDVDTKCNIEADLKTFKLFGWLI